KGLGVGGGCGDGEEEGGKEKGTDHGDTDGGMERRRDGANRAIVTQESAAKYGCPDHISSAILSLCVRLLGIDFHAEARQTRRADAGRAIETRGVGSFAGGGRGAQLRQRASARARGG